MNQERLLTAKEVCQWLKITRPTLDNLRKKGMLKTIKIGNSVRFLETDVRDFLNQNKN